MLINRVVEVIVNPLIVLLFGEALLVFVWGAFEFVMHADSEEGKKTGAKHMLWGIVGLVIMVSVLGIQEIIENTLKSL